jgi:hypothetical protein
MIDVNAILVAMVLLYKMETRTVLHRGACAESGQLVKLSLRLNPFPCVIGGVNLEMGTVRH